MYVRHRPCRIYSGKRREMYKIAPTSGFYTPQIHEIEKECFGDPWSLTALNAEVELPNTICLMALDTSGTLVAGHISMRHVINEGHAGIDIKSQWRCPHRRARHGGFNDPLAGRLTPDQPVAVLTPLRQLARDADAGRSSRTNHARSARCT